MITIFGSPNSSSGRCYWCLEEVEATYESKPLNFKEKEHKSEEFLKVNPNGKVPALVDGDFKIWESMAINFYLADKYKPEILGNTSEERGLVHQWSIWSIADLQSPLIDIFIQKVFVPEERRSQAVIDKAMAKLPNLLGTLDQALEGNSYLLGEKFSLADINVASVIAICNEIDLDMSPFSHLISWQKKLSQRPSHQKWQALCK